MQQVYEFVVRAGRAVRTREIVAAIGTPSVSSVTYALTRLCREGNIERVGYAEYRIKEGNAARESPALEPFANDERMKRIFEAIRPSLSFDDLAFLYNAVLTAMRLAPDLFRAPTKPETDDQTPHA